MEKEMEELREASSQLAAVQTELAEAATRAAELEKLYKEEQILRKRYWNMMEVRQMAAVPAHASCSASPLPCCVASPWFGRT